MMPLGRLKGHVVTEETRKKISLSHKMLNKIPWNKGKTGVYSKETLERMSKGLKGRTAWNKGKKGSCPHSEEWRKIVSKKMKGKNTWTKGRPAWNKGIKTGKSSWNKGIPNLKFRGENNPNWNGGKSFEIYPVDWTRTLKISIRERDKYTCQLCGEKQGDEAHSIHHIDYDKKNCDPDNLISLCRRCHMKTGFNRKHWINYFKNRAAQLASGK